MNSNDLGANTYAHPMGAYRVAVEVPLSDEERRKRTLPRGISRLILSGYGDTSGGAGTISCLSNCAWAWREHEEFVYAVPIVQFISDQDLTNIADALGARLRNSEGEKVLCCESASQLECVMERLLCEELVLFYATSNEEVDKTLAAARLFSAKYTSHNAPYFAIRPRGGGIVFYAPNHYSLEALGDFDFVLRRCLERAITSFT